MIIGYFQNQKKLDTLLTSAQRLLKNCDKEEILFQLIAKKRRELSNGELREFYNWLGVPFIPATELIEIKVRYNG
jgi:hypothetical protein